MGIGYPDTLNSYLSPFNKNGKNKKKQKKYNNLANVLNVNTVKDTIIGPSSSRNIAAARGNMFSKQQLTSNKPGPRYINSLPNPYKVKGVSNKGKNEYYTIHKK